MADQFYYNNVYFSGSDLAGQTAEIYEPRAGMSLDETSELYGTFWLCKNGVILKSGLGDAEFRVFDRDGNLVGWLAESGLTADAEGYYHITPVSAQALTAFRHFVFEVTISYQGQDYVNAISANVTG